MLFVVSFNQLAVVIRQVLSFEFVRFEGQGRARGEVEWRPTGGREFGGVKEDGTLPRLHNGSANFFSVTLSVRKLCPFQILETAPRLSCLAMEPIYLAGKIDQCLSDFTFFISVQFFVCCWKFCHQPSSLTKLKN